MVLVPFVTSQRADFQRSLLFYKLKKKKKSICLRDQLIVEETGSGTVVQMVDPCSILEFAYFYISS